MSDAPSLDALARLAAAAAEHLAALDSALREACETGCCGSCPKHARIYLARRAMERDGESAARHLVAAVDALRAERDRRDAERLAIADALELQPIATHEQCVSAARVLSGALTNALDTLGAQSRLLEGKHTPEDGVSLLVSAVLGFADDAPNSAEFRGTWLARRFHLTVQWADGQTPGEMLTEMQGERDAAIARATAAEAQRDALAAAVREHLDAADAGGCGNGEPTMAEYAVAQVARKHLDALLSGAPADVVRAGVVREACAVIAESFGRVKSADWATAQAIADAIRKGDDE